ncbi:extracellular solute-binding protein [Paenibacillus lignilyticus]|uniref:Extracellular solute-binding protein n=1 Tax=Paenibacillus lignilyticus TaxID=1172615 RepID=A0ABS5CAH4_9BACL|nr:extracellular solute-binding protein [Paenibacillus lignilyticus]MBP3962450.1 extracellular solute-binding protein [Paenibacillus lignilyticus]
MNRWASSFLIISLIATMTACSSNNDNAANDQASETDNAVTTNNATTTTEKTDDAATENVDPLGKYPETLTVTEVLGYGPPEDPKTPAGLTPDQNAYLKDLKEQLNIDLKYKWTVPTDQYEQKFSLSIASGDLPDIMDVDIRNFEKFKNQGVLADLTDAYEKYASPTLRKFMESDGGQAMKSLTSDGKLYGIPGFEEPFLSTQILWIRADWLKNVNLEAPKTIDDLEKIATAFVNSDPDKNGKKDTYGLALQKNIVNWGFDTRGLFFGFNAYPSGWIKGSDGKLVPGEIQPEMKPALSKLQSWYKNGILDKEFALKDENKVVEDIVGSKVGMLYGEWWLPNWPLNLNKDADPNAEWICVQIPSLDGSPGKSLVPKVRMGHIVVVNSKFSNPEAAIKMINFYIEMNTKAHYDTNKPENGYVYNWFVPRIYNPVEIQTIHDEVNNAIANKVNSVSEDIPYYVNIQKPLEAAQKFLSGDKTGWGLYSSRVSKDGGWGLTSQIRDSNQFVYNEFYGSATESQVENGAQLDKLMNETFTKIIMGESIDSFDKFVSSWKALGGDDVTAEVNEWYSSASK